MPAGAVDPLDAVRAALPADIATQLGRNEDVEYKKAAERQAQMMGIKELMAEKEARIAAREVRDAAAQKQRIPAWAMGAMGATQPRGGGLGSLLASWGGGTEKAAQGYSAADLAASEKIDALRDAISQAKLEGNKGMVAAGEAALKNLTDQKTNARTTGTSLINTAENAAARLQIAKDNAAARIAAAGEGRLNRESAQAERVFATQSNAALQRATSVVAAEEKAAELSMTKNPVPAEERILEMYTKFLRASLPPTMQHMAPAEYKKSTGAGGDLAAAAAAELVRRGQK
jgi:hypothetical protein